MVPTGGTLGEGGRRWDLGRREGTRSEGGEAPGAVERQEWGRCRVAERLREVPEFEGAKTPGPGMGLKWKSHGSTFPLATKPSCLTSGLCSNSGGPGCSEGVPAAHRPTLQPATQAPHPQDVLPSARSPPPSQAASTPPRPARSPPAFLPPHLPARSRGPQVRKTTKFHAPRRGDPPAPETRRRGVLGQRSGADVSGVRPLAALNLPTPSLPKGRTSLQRSGEPNIPTAARGAAPPSLTACETESTEPLEEGLLTC